MSGGGLKKVFGRVKNILEEDPGTKDTEKILKKLIDRYFPSYFDMIVAGA
jgi:hypothetical protein